jgi:hypothetical protein
MSISEIYALAMAKDQAPPRAPLGSRYLHHSPWLPEKLHDAFKMQRRRTSEYRAPYKSDKL